MNAILDLINWCKQNPLKEQQYFKGFSPQKDNIFVNISLEDESVGGNIVKLLRHKEKLEKLTEIAETGVNLSDLKTIAEISKVVGMERIKAEAEKLQLEKEDFEFKKAIGENIEESLINAFKSENLNYQINYQGIGDKDIIITNPINRKEYYIEVKSLSPTNRDKNIRIAIKQGEKAIECISTKNYSLAILVRPNSWADANVGYIKSNLKSLINVGTILTDIVSRNNQFKTLIQSQNGVSLEFEDIRRKIKLAEDYWRGKGKSFADLIQEIKENLK